MVSPAASQPDILRAFASFLLVLFLLYSGLVFQNILLEFQSSLPRHSSHINILLNRESEKTTELRFLLAHSTHPGADTIWKYLPMFKNYHSQRLPRLAALQPNTSTHPGSALSTRPSSPRLLCPPRPRVCPHKAAAWTRYGINSHYNSGKRAKPQPQHIAPAKKLAKKTNKKHRCASISRPHSEFPLRDIQGTTGGMCRIMDWNVEAKTQACVPASAGSLCPRCHHKCWESTPSPTHAALIDTSAAMLQQAVGVLSTSFSHHRSACSHLCSLRFSRGATLEPLRSNHLIQSTFFFFFKKASVMTFNCL